jgi:hypothetical protein
MLDSTFFEHIDETSTISKTHRSNTKHLFIAISKIADSHETNYIFQEFETIIPKLPFAHATLTKYLKSLEHVLDELKRVYNGKIDSYTDCISKERLANIRKTLNKKSNENIADIPNENINEAINNEINDDQSSCISRQVEYPDTVSRDTSVNDEPQFLNEIINTVDEKEIVNRINNIEKKIYWISRILCDTLQDMYPACKSLLTEDIFDRAIPK